MINNTITRVSAFHGKRLTTNLQELGHRDNPPTWEFGEMAIIPADETTCPRLSIGPHACRGDHSPSAKQFLCTDFPILVSEFKFPPRSRIWDASHFSFLDSRCKSKDAHGLEIAQFQFLISRFTILVSKRPLHIPNPPVPHFSFLVSGFKGALLSRDLRRAHFSIPISQFSLHRLQRIERR